MPGGAGGSYLPPVVAHLIADADPMLRTLAEAKAELEDFADTPTTAQITGDITPLEGALAAARAEADAATAKPIEFTVTANTTSALGDIAAARAAGGFASTTGGGGMFGGLAGVAAAHAVAGGGGGGGGIVPGAALGAAAAGGGGGGGGKGLLAALGWGGGMFGMAGMGSILSLAGFGPEHLITTGLGLAGSAAGGALGGGLLASGWAGTAAVGGGSDMAVMKSVMTDTFTAQKSLYNEFANLNNMVLIYGQNSAQAAAAQADLNNQMIILGNTAGVAAELGLAKSVDALNRYWDQATSGARIAAVSILSQGVTLANEYVPLVAAAAQQNFGIISTGLRPLFAWLGGPEGVGIFLHLEDVFAHNLPTAVDAFDQAVMLVLRTVNVASDYTGHFIVTIDNFLQRMNTPAGFAKWSVEIGTLIGLFRDWEALIVIATRDVADFFKLSSGLGTGIVLSLTQALTALNAWETSVSGASQLHALFAAHLNEVLDALKLVYGIIPGLAEVYLRLAVPLTTVADAFIRFGDFILNTPIIGQLVAYGWAIAFVAGKLQLLTLVKFIGDIPLLGGLIVKLVGWLGTLALGWLGVARAADTAAASQAVAGTASVAASAESTAASGARLTGGGILGLLSGGATSGPALAAAFAGLGTAAAAAVGLAGLLYGAGYAITALTGHVNDVSGEFAALKNPAIEMVGNFNLSATQSDYLRNTIASNAPLLAQSLTAITKSAYFQSLNSFQQQTFMSELTAAMQKFGPADVDIGTFTKAYKDMASKSALTVPLVDGVLQAYQQDEARLVQAIHATTNAWMSIDHGTTQTTVPSSQEIANAFQQTVPISEQIKSILQYTQTGASNVGSGVWNAVGGAQSLSGALWNSTGPASGISPAASSLAASLWAASSAADGVRRAIQADTGNISNIVAGVVAPGHALGGTIPPGTWGIINEIRAEPVYAMPGGGGMVFPRANVTPFSPSGGGGTTNVTITSNPVFNITGLPSQIADQVRAIVHDSNQQLVAAIGG